MADTVYGKLQRSDGLQVKVVDLTGTGGPVGEVAPGYGWDAVNLIWRRIAVDTLGQLLTSGTSSGGGGGVVTQGTASNLNATVVGTVTTVPSGTQLVSQSGSPWGISGTVTTTPNGTGTELVAVQNTVTVQGTTTTVPSGTQTISGTVTSVLSGTAAVTQVTSPWIVDGTTTSVPSGTQAVAITALNTRSVDTQSALQIVDIQVLRKLDELLNLQRQQLELAHQATTNRTFTMGKVGPHAYADGMPAYLRYDKNGCLLSANGPAFCQEAVLRGNVYTSWDGDGHSSLNGTANIGCIVYNPLNSGKNLVLWDALIAPNANFGTGALSANLCVFFVTIPCPAPTGASLNTNANWNNLLGAPFNSVAKCYTTATFNQSSGTQDVFQLFQQQTAVGMTNFLLHYDIRGKLVVQPGIYVNIGMGGNQVSHQAALTWEEIPI